MARDSIEKEAECEDFVIDIPAELPPAEWPEYCCIYRVHKKLHNVSNEAYTPKLVSIGPLHHGREELRDMEMHKLRYFKDFFQLRTQKSQKDLASIIAAKEEKIRHCYSETSKLSSKDFVKMILLDSIFIIELFLKDYERAEEEDYILRTAWLRDGIFIDLILLENQLPFFVLEDLHTSAFYASSSNLSHQKEDQNKEDTPFLKLARCFFSYYDMDKQRKSNIHGEVKHLTDLVRYFLCSPTQKRRVIGKKQKNLACTEHVHHLRSSATELDRAELKFKAVENRHLLDITFAGNKWLKYCPCFNLSWLLACLPCLEFPCLESMQCVLEVPPIVIDDYTEAVFRNLIALEQCLYQRKAYICNYAALLDNLIDTEEDVKFLVHEKVIVNNIGSNAAVATLINKLCLGIVEDQSCYAVLVKQIDRYSNNPWSRIMATMKSVYFRDFWRGTATLVGLVILISQFRDLLRFLH